MKASSSLLARARILGLLLPVFALFSTAEVACGGKVLDDFSQADDETYGSSTYGGKGSGSRYGGRYGGSGYGGGHGP